MEENGRFCYCEFWPVFLEEQALGRVSSNPLLFWKSWDRGSGLLVTLSFSGQRCSSKVGSPLAAESFAESFHSSLESLGNAGGLTGSSRKKDESLQRPRPRPEVSEWQWKRCTGFLGLKTNSRWERRLFEKKKRDIKFYCMGQNISPQFN